MDMRAFFDGKGKAKTHRTQTLQKKLYLKHLKRNTPKKNFKDGLIVIHGGTGVMIEGLKQILKMKMEE